MKKLTIMTLAVAGISLAGAPVAAASELSNVDVADDVIAKIIAFEEELR